MKKKVLLTGGYGFVGSAVNRALSTEYDVITIGRNPKCDIKLDLCAIPDGLVLQDNYYAFVHCAGAIDEEFKLDFQGAWHRTVYGTSKLIDIVQKARVERLVDISTAHVYGKQIGRIDEESQVDPISDYALAHFIVEQKFKHSGKNTLVLRPSTIYGISSYMEQYSRHNLIPYAFVRDMLEHKCINIHTSGDQQLNFVHVDAIGMLIKKYLDQNEIKTSCQAINVAGHEHLSVVNYANMVAEEYFSKTGIKGKVTCNPTKKIGDPNFLYCSKYVIDSGCSVREEIDLLMKKLSLSINEGF